MSKNIIEEFNSYREKMNERILATDNKILKRIFSVDSMAYQEGALSVQTKELLGLMGSLVLRCDDCIKYHVQKAWQEGVTKEQIIETFALANVVGGTIVIPHTRRALEFLESLEESSSCT
jgi:AhpD family alkylhydroperoxidase